MIIQSTRFGELEISEDDIIKFPEGLCGFPYENSFILISHQPDSPFIFMQSVSEPDLTFVMLETFKLSKEYEFTLNDQVVQELNLSTNNPPQIYNIVTTPQKIDEMTVNLLAPIVIDVNHRIAKQVVLENVPYKVRHRLFIEGLSQMIKEHGK